jgi:hypothetical protein
LTLCSFKISRSARSWLILAQRLAASVLIGGTLTNDFGELVSVLVDDCGKKQ